MLQSCGRRAVRSIDRSRCISSRTLSSAVPQKRATATSVPSAAPFEPPAPPEPSTSFQQRTSPFKEPTLPSQPYLPRPLSRSLQIKSVNRSVEQHDSVVIELEAPQQQGKSHVLTLPNLFLRDSSVHPNHVHPSSKQKLFRTTDVPRDSQVKGYGVHEIDGQDHLIMEWSTRLKGFGEKDDSATLSVTPLDLLVGLLREQHPLTLPHYTPWTRRILTERLQSRTFDDVMSKDRATLEMLDDLLRDGIAFVKQVPTDKKAGQHTDLRTLVERISSIRNTWYGNLFDVKAEVGSKNIAYTNLDLGLHMDLVHFETPPRYQFLHSLQNNGVRGGASYFVDSYAVAQRIRETDPVAFDVLASEPVLFEYRSDAHHTRFERPTIELDEDGQTITAINYSPPFQGPLPLTRLVRERATTTSNDVERLNKLRDGLEQFANLCDDERYRYNVQLEPGDCVIFDNRRVLHARTAFEFVEQQQRQQSGGRREKEEEEEEEEEERGRWLKGAYCDGDEVASKWRILADKRRRGKLE
ncbi:hypothetical protein ACM66B_006078 [Microbotryomycetes sp. NB124-2]